MAGEVSAGSRGGDRGAAVGDAQAGPVNLFAAVSSEQGDRWTPVVQGRGPADDALTLHDWNAAGRAQMQVGRAVIAAHLGAYEEDRDSGLVGAVSRSRGQDASLTAAAQPTNTDLGWRLQGWVRHSDLLNTSVSTATSRGFTTPSNNEYSTPATGWGVNAAVRKAGDWGDLEVGADLREFTGKDHELFSYVGSAYTKNRLAGGEEGVAGVYVEGARAWAGWLLTGGLRVDGWRQTDAQLIERSIATGAITLNSPTPDKSGSQPTGRVALRRDLSDGLYLRAAAYTGFRQPTLNELDRPYRVGNNVIEANPLLKPERLSGFEGGVGGDTGPVKWSATLFDNRLADPVINATIGVGPGNLPHRRRGSGRRHSLQARERGGDQRLWRGGGRGGPPAAAADRQARRRLYRRPCGRRSGRAATDRQDAGPGRQVHRHGLGRPGRSPRAGTSPPACAMKACATTTT